MGSAKNKRSFLLGLIYKPNYSDMLQENKEESILENSIRRASEVSNRIIICGDFNIDMKTPENLQTQQLSTLYETYQLKNNSSQSPQELIHQQEKVP